MQQLLFYSLSTGSGATAISNAMGGAVIVASNISGGVEEEAGQQQQQHVPTPPSFSYPAVTASATRLNPSQALSMDASKQSKLEQRLGVGGEIARGAFFFSPALAPAPVAATYHTGAPEYTTATASTFATSIGNVGSFVCGSSAAGTPGGRGRGKGGGGKGSGPTEAFQTTFFGPASSQRPGRGSSNNRQRYQQSQHRGTDTAPSSTMSGTTVADPFRMPGILFGGPEQFFFRFIVQLSHRPLGQYLENAVAAQAMALLPRSLLNSSSATISRATSLPGSRNTSSKHNRSSTTSTSSVDHRNGIGESTGFRSGITGDTGSGKWSRAGVGVEEEVHMSEEAFALKVAKLKILGRFLGLLSFHPQWVLSSELPLDSPLRAAELACMGTTRRSGSSGSGSGSSSTSSSNNSNGNGSIDGSTGVGSFFRKSWPIAALVQGAWCNGALALVVPFAVEFLKMIQFTGTVLHDPTLHCAPYYDTFALLRAVQLSDRFALTQTTLSSNR